MGRSSGKGRTSDIIKARWPDYGITLNESRHALDFSMETIRRPYFKIFFVVQGRTIFRVNGLAVRLNEKDCVAVAKEVPHRIEDPGNRDVTIYILSIRDQAYPAGSEERALLDSLNTEPDLSGRVLSPMSDNGAEFAHYLRLIRREQLEHRPEEAMAVRSAVTALLIRLKRDPSTGSATPAQSKPAVPDKSRVREMGAYVKRNFPEPLTVSGMAALCHLPINRFISAFKQQFKMTPLQYLHRARISFAKKRLSDSRDSIATVCFDAGFNDLSFFYRTFRKITGKPPRAWRQFRQPISTIIS